MAYVETDQLEDFLIKENSLILMAVNHGDSYIPLQVLARDEEPYLYDTVAEGMLPNGLAASSTTNGVTNLTFQTALQLSSQNLPNKPTDVFDISKFPAFLYQIFYGISPPAVRVYRQQPWHVNQGALPTIGYQPAYAQSGYRDGFLSPLLKPHPKTEFFVLPGLSFAMGFANILPEAVYPELMFWINALNVAVVTDAEIVYSMFHTPGTATIYTVAGLTDVSYSIPTYYKVKGVTPVMTKGQIQQALQV